MHVKNLPIELLPMMLTRTTASRPARAN